MSLWELGKELGFSEKETVRIADYLKGEELIKHRASGGMISITHHGVIQVEEALSKPDQSTEYFPPINLIQIGQMIGSQIQQGNYQSTQTGLFSEGDLQVIDDFIQTLKGKLSELKLDSDKQGEAEAEISSIEAQIRSPHPKPAIINECLSSLRSILEGAAGNVIAGLMLQQLLKIIGS